ncbi:MAG: alpha/beta fold hydrolase [Phycisphaerales bacterium JB040]
MTLACAATLALTAAAGCYSYRPAPADAGPLPVRPIENWPRPALEPVRDVADATPARGEPLGFDEPVEIEWSMADTGLVRLFKTPPEARVREAWEEPWSYGVSLPTDGSLLTSWELEDARATERRMLQRRERRVNRSAQRAGLHPGVETDPDEAMLDAGVDFTLPIDRRWHDPDNEPRGLVVHLESLIPTKYELRITDAFERDGWAVTHVDTHQTIWSPRRRAYLDALLRRSDDLRRAENAPDHTGPGDPASSTESPPPLPPAPPPPFPLDEDTDAAALGAELGEAVDRILGANAYGAVVAIEESQRLHPSLVGKPIVVFGCSAGALSGPTVGARIREVWPDRPLAVILVGGGGDVLRISQESVISDGGITMRRRDDPPLDPDRFQEALSSYRASSRLDPLRAIQALRDVPVLLVYADEDRVVPTSATERLAEAHGRADRLIHDGSHGSLFYFLDSQRGRLVRWANKSATERVHTPDDNH